MGGGGGGEGGLRGQLVRGRVGVVVVDPHQVQVAHGAGPDVVAGKRLLDVLVIVNERMDVVQRLPQRQVLVLVVQFLLAGVGEALPAQRVDEERMFLEVPLESILLAEDVGVLIVDDLLLVAHVVQRLVVVVVEGVVAVVGFLFPGAEAEHRPHAEHFGQRRYDSSSLHLADFTLTAATDTHTHTHSQVSCPYHHPVMTRLVSPHHLKMAATQHWNILVPIPALTPPPRVP